MYIYIYIYIYIYVYIGLTSRRCTTKQISFWFKHMRKKQAVAALFVFGYLPETMYALSDSLPSHMLNRYSRISVAQPQDYY